MVYIKPPHSKAQIAALEKVRAAAAALEAAKAGRDTAVVGATDRGASRRDVADAAGITPARVQQIVADNRE